MFSVVYRGLTIINGFEKFKQHINSYIGAFYCVFMPLKAHLGHTVTLKS